jgi:hypothetical protein
MSLTGELTVRVAGPAKRAGDEREPDVGRHGSGIAVGAQADQPAAAGACDLGEGPDFGYRPL